MKPVGCTVDRAEYVLPDSLITGFSDFTFDMTPWEHPTHVVRSLPNGLLDVSDTPHHLSYTYVLSRHGIIKLLTKSIAFIGMRQLAHYSGFLGKYGTKYTHTSTAQA